MNFELQQEFKTLLKETGVSKNIHKYLNGIGYIKRDQKEAYIQEVEPLFALSRLSGLPCNTETDNQNLLEANKKWITTIITKDWSCTTEEWYDCLALLEEEYGKELLLQATTVHIEKGLWGYKKGKENLSGKSNSKSSNKFYDDLLADLEERMQCLKDIAETKNLTLEKVLQPTARKESFVSFHTLASGTENNNDTLSDAEKVSANRNKTVESLCETFKSHSEAMVNCISQMVKLSNEYVGQSTIQGFKKDLDSAKTRESELQEQISHLKQKLEKRDQDYQNILNNYKEKAGIVNEQKKQLTELNKANKALEEELEEYKKANNLLHTAIEEESSKKLSKKIPMSELKNVDMLGPTAIKNLIPILKGYGLDVDTNK